MLNGVNFLNLIKLFIIKLLYVKMSGWFTTWFGL
jgi:hypothetical protein